ncbi:MAG TPA: hydroxysqualene dehydroxylase HpnE [Acetobacteraceae bacterium]|nr:hydroxysqualene dehydroxylase HpnE [Acetobacteraceae bacterium]
MPQAHIIGGGLAGLAAALDLQDAGWQVSLYEAGPALGGRCRSYFDRELGCRIDNGNHLLLSGNRAAMGFLARIGSRDTLGGPAEPLFPFVDLTTGERWTVRPNRGRLPWWVFVRNRRVPGARPGEFLSLLSLSRAGAEATVADTLRPGALYRRLLEPLAIAALNTSPETGSARLLDAVVRETLAQGGEACVPVFPREGLSESFIDPAAAYLSARGAEIRTGSRVAGLTIEGGRVAELALPEGKLPLGPEDAVVLAVPPPVAATLLPGLTVPDQFEAIANLHYRFEAEPGPAGFIGLVGGTAEWVFVKPGIVSITISAANRLADHAPEALAETVWREVQAALGITAPLPAWRLVREKRATFAATPAQDARRPGPRAAGLANLALAGDWTATGLPATIEGAIRSGCTAARALRAA